MDSKKGKTVAGILGALGLLLILAGPGFQFIPTNVGIFLALASWIVAGLIRTLSKDEEKPKEEEKSEEEE